MPTSQYSSDGGHEAVEDLLLLLSLTFEDYALSLEPGPPHTETQRDRERERQRDTLIPSALVCPYAGAEPTQGAVAFLATLVAGLPVTMLRLTALI